MSVALPRVLVKQISQSLEIDATSTTQGTSQSHHFYIVLITLDICT